MTFTRLEHCTLIVMAVVEVIYAVAATLWIVVVMAALCVSFVVIAKYRKRRRRVNRLLHAMRMPVAGATALSKVVVELPRMLIEFSDGGTARSSASRRRR